VWLVRVHIEEEREINTGANEDERDHADHDPEDLQNGSGRMPALSRFVKGLF
jgi:hypothetical protein